MLELTAKLNSLRYKLDRTFRDRGSTILLVSTQHVDVLILDLSMPGLGGLAALPRLRAAAPHLRVLVLSSYPESAFARKAIALGASGYFEKPPDLDLLTATLRKAMQEPVPPVAGTVAA